MSVKGAFVNFMRKTRGRDSREVTFPAFGTVEQTTSKNEAGEEVKELELIEEGQVTTVQEAINIATSSDESTGRVGLTEQEIADAIIVGLNKRNYARAVGVDELDELLASVFDMNDEAQKAQASSLKRGANANAKGLTAQGIETTPLAELSAMIERIIAQRSK